MNLQVSIVWIVTIFVIHSDDVSELYPVSRLEQEVKGEKDIYGPGNLQDTYYQVLLSMGIVPVVH
jgi:hypothetical protein